MNGEEIRLLWEFQDHEQRPGETPLCWLDLVLVLTGEGLNIRNGILICTDQRVVFYGTSTAGNACDSYPHTKISAVYTEKAPLFGRPKVVLQIVGNRVLLFSTQEGDLFVEDFVAAANNPIVQQNQATPAAAHEAEQGQSHLENWDEYDEGWAEQKVKNKRRTVYGIAMAACLFMFWSSYSGAKKEREERARAAEVAEMEATQERRARLVEAAREREKKNELRLAEQERQKAFSAEIDRLGKDPALIGQWRWYMGAMHVDGIQCVYTLLKKHGHHTMDLVCDDSPHKNDAGDRMKTQRTKKGLKLKTIGGFESEYFILTDSGVLESYDEMGLIVRMRSL